MTSTIESLFTRPLRQTYFMYDLGPHVFFIDAKKVVRSDFTLPNSKNINIQVSFYEYESELLQNTVIYLHTHHGSRLEGTSLIQPTLKSGMNLCLFDFAGYGNSEGETVTLGIQQTQDIDIVISHLCRNFRQQKIILWGRSMGAVTALLYLYRKRQQDHRVIGGVYDSPFYSLQKLTLQLGSRNSGLPEIILKPLIYILRNALHDKIDFEQLELVKRIDKILIPGIFITSKEDQFVSYLHSEVLYKYYAGVKEIYYIQRDHNQTRKQTDLTHVFKFMNSLIEQPHQKWKSVVNNHLNLIVKKPQLYYKIVISDEIAQNKREFLHLQQ